MPIPLEQFTLLYVQNIRNCMLDKQGSQSLNERFNCHRSDEVHHPGRSDLAQHYNENDCDIRHDLEILVLEHARVSSDYMKPKENIDEL